MRYGLWMSAFLFMAGGLAQAGDLVFPWVTNNANFRSTIVINNLNDSAIIIELRATRALGAPGTAEEMFEIELGPFEQLVADAGELFTEMGEGPGYMVRLTSIADNVTGGFVVSATSTASGNSPAQANAVIPNLGDTIQAFNFLPIGASGFSAPVIVNLGDSDAAVTMKAYQNGQEVSSAERMVGAQRPYAEGANTLFPGVAGNIYVVAQSTAPILGVSFIFNGLGEPSMANTTPLGFVPNPDSNNNGPTVSFANDIQPIFTSSCGNGLCHLEGANQSNLTLDEGQAYQNIVSVPAIQAFLNRIEPFDPDRSWLFLRLFEGNGERMPRERDPLPAEKIELIRTWILEGALNN